MWGEGSRNYSEEIIKRYLCKHGLLVQQRSGNQLTIIDLIAVHVGGSTDHENPTNLPFIKYLTTMLRSDEVIHQYINYAGIMAQLTFKVMSTCMSLINILHATLE